MPEYTVGWYDATINDWYFNGEYGTYDAAVACAKKTAVAKQSRVRITYLSTGYTEYFDASGKPE